MLRQDFAICRAMGGWTLEAVRNLEQDEYDELVQLLLEEADRAKHGEDGINVDELQAAERASVLKKAIRG